MSREGFEFTAAAIKNHHREKDKRLSIFGIRIVFQKRPAIRSVLLAGGGGGRGSREEEEAAETILLYIYIALARLAFSIKLKTLNIKFCGLCFFFALGWLCRYLKECQMLFL